MTLIQPVSSLSIKRAVNLYTIILFLSFGMLLYWLANDRLQVFISSHTDTASNTTKIVSFQISKALEEKQRIIDIFVESSRPDISRLVDDPDNTAASTSISSRLQKYLPDFRNYKIVTISGDSILDSAEDPMPEDKNESIRNYLQSGKQHIKIHHDKDENHYDIFSKLVIEDRVLLFIVNFGTNDLSVILESAEPAKHHLLLINGQRNQHIAVRPHNETGRSENTGRRVNGGDRLRTLSNRAVPETQWEVIDMYDDNLFRDYKMKIVKEYLIGYYIFSIIVLFMRNILINQDKKRTAAEELLQKNHKQIRQLNDQLELLSRTDSLTGLYNRRYFDELIYQEWNRSIRSRSRLSCILFDIDFFKNFNDYYGHQAGDKCLKDISCLMNDTFRRAGDVVARYGGEEFIVIMADSTLEDAVKAVSLFQHELAKLGIRHERSEVNEFVTISAGIVNDQPSQKGSIEEFIRKADDALYAAKDIGRNRYMVSSG